MKEAEEQWQGFAEEIRAGKRKAFLDHLEERGLVNQVVGSASLVPCTGTFRYSAIVITMVIGG